jgi:hypothetical protein
MTHRGRDPTPKFVPIARTVAVANDRLHEGFGELSAYRGFAVSGRRDKGNKAKLLRCQASEKLGAPNNNRSSVAFDEYATLKP